ncbi:MAG: hypothetical protein JW715_04675 [Sedimentisphaerales bacterium]|nr:hypothetical protein [Sedimentisphaerales bacterium]
MRKTMYLLSIVLMLVSAGFSSAAGAGGSTDENAELRQKIDKLDKELESLRQTFAQQSGTSVDVLPKPVWSNLDIQLYGYLKLDSAYDTSRIENGNYAKWVTSESTNDDDDQFNMTANETRLGMLINGPDNGGVITSGRVEVDFYGGGDENKSHLMMRHAYLKLDWPQSRFSILAGQTSDVISPLFPSTINYSVGWWTGNIGYRRPQVRFTKEISIKDDLDLKLEGAFARTIGRADAVASPNGTESGEDAGSPSVQGRASMKIPLFWKKVATIGISGHYGKEEYDLTTTGRNTEFKTWSLNMDLEQPVNDKLAIKAEIFTGKNLDAYLGGIGQGVITDTTQAVYYEEIASRGGWIAASIGPWKNKKFNLGLAMDDVDGGDINTGDRTLNRSVFGNVVCSLNKQTDVGFELSHWRTEYKGPGDGDSLRAQLALIYKF